MVWYNPRMKDTRAGFTIVELLIVIVVIGILAAITIVAFNGVQNRANDTAVRSDLASMAKKIEYEAADSSGVYPFPLTASMDLKFSKGSYRTAENNLYYCVNTSTNQYAAGARSKSNKQFKIVNGTVSEHATTLYGADVCALVGLSSWSGTYGRVGFDGASQTWDTWAK